MSRYGSAPPPGKYEKAKMKYVVERFEKPKGSGEYRWGVYTDTTPRHLVDDFATEGEADLFAFDLTQQQSSEPR